MADLTVIDAGTAVELDCSDGVIAGLRGRLYHLTADTDVGYQEVKAGIREVSKYRTGVERSRKELKKSAIDWGKKVDAEAKRVTKLLLEIETPLRLEKQKVDDEADRIRREEQDRLRLAEEAKQEAERKVRTEEEAAKREAERKEREAETAKLAEDRRILETDRKKLELEREKIANEREDIEAKQRSMAEKAFAAESKQREAKDRKRVEEEIKHDKAEAKRLAEERKPDEQKLREFGDMLGKLEFPQLQTEWGEGMVVSIAELLNQAIELTQ